MFPPLLTDTSTSGNGGAPSPHKKPLPAQADPEENPGARTLAGSAMPRQWASRPPVLQDQRTSHPGRGWRAQSEGSAGSRLPCGPGAPCHRASPAAFRLAGSRMVRRHSARAQTRSRDALCSARVFRFLQSYVHVVLVILL